MSKTDTIYAVLIAVVLLACWCVWYRVSSAEVEYCMSNYDVCAAAYYSNK